MVKHTQTILSVFDRFMKLALKGLICNRPLNQFLRSLCISLSELSYILLVLVITCLVDQFGINCPSAFMEILKLPG